MRVVFLGKANSGSWQIRAVQMAAGLRKHGIDAEAVPIGSQDWQQKTAEAAQVVWIKRHRPEATWARSIAKRFIWDAVDFWRQPTDNVLNEQAALAALQAEIDRFKPDGMLGATQAMATAMGGNAIHLPHHYRPEIKTTRHDAAPAKIIRVGYEGNAIYLGRYAEWVREWAEKRRCTFIVNPRRSDQSPGMDSCDVVFAARDGEHDGYMPRQWKSNVKQATAYGHGIPFACNMADGYGSATAKHLGLGLYLGNGGFLFTDKSSALKALDELRCNTTREIFGNRCLDIRPQFSLPTVSKTLARYLEQIN